MNKPKELPEALEEHVDLLLRQLGSVTSDLPDGQVTMQLLGKCVDLAMVLSRLARYIPHFNILFFLIFFLSLFP